MSSGQRNSWGRETAPSGSSQDRWRRLSIRTTAEIGSVLSTVTAAMVVEEYPERAVFGVQLALEEALVNAINHGHQGDPSKLVRVRYRINTKCLEVEVKDQGTGFNPQQLPDPVAPENLERTSGRGVFLMRHYMTWVKYNRRGNSVTLCKHRTS